MSIRIKVQRLPHAHGLALPAYQSADSSGLDLLAAIEGSMEIGPGGRALVPTGMIVELPRGIEAQIRPRSGLALRYGVTCHWGTIDCDFRGDVSVLLMNLGDKPFAFSRGDRIAQLVIQRVERAALVEVSEVKSSARAAGGFGSTGVR